MSEFTPVSQSSATGNDVAQNDPFTIQSQTIASQDPYSKQGEFKMASSSSSSSSQETIGKNASMTTQPEFMPLSQEPQESQTIPTQSTQSTQPSIIEYTSDPWVDPSSTQKGTISSSNINNENGNGDDDDDDGDNGDIGNDDERDSFRAIIEGDDAEILRRFSEESTQVQPQVLEAPKASLPNPVVDELQQPSPSQALSGAAAENGMAAAVDAATVTPVAPAFKVTPILQNIVATVNLGCPLDLKKITAAARNTEYNPQRFPALIMRIRDPKATALIFASGKVVCTGTKSEEMAKYAAKKFARIIQKIGFQVKFKGFKVQNIVASCDVKFPIRLEQLSQEVDRFSTYEPEIFPGLIFRMAEPRVSLLIFVSGKIVLSGAKTIGDIRDAFNSIIPVLRKYQKTL